MFNQDALFKGYKKRLEKLPKPKAGSEGARMVRAVGRTVDGVRDGVVTVLLVAIVLVVCGVCEFGV